MAPPSITGQTAMVANNKQNTNPNARSELVSVAFSREKFSWVLNDQASLTSESIEVYLGDNFCAMTDSK